jgi:PhnB protein
MPTTTNSTTAIAQIREVRERLTKAIRAKDADSVASHYAADNVMFILAPPLQYTPDNAPGTEGMEEWFATWRGPLGYEIRDLSITTGEDVAFCHSLNRLSGTKTDGETVDMWLRETLCFRKIDDAWKITHQHESVPFYMDGSYKAAVDLTP